VFSLNWLYCLFDSNINIYKTLTSVPSRGREGVRQKNGKIGGGLAAHERASFKYLHWMKLYMAYKQSSIQHVEKTSFWWEKLEFSWWDASPSGKTTSMMAGFSEWIQHLNFSSVICHRTNTYLVVSSWFIQLYTIFYKCMQEILFSRSFNWDYQLHILPIDLVWPRKFIKFRSFLSFSNHYYDS